MRHEAGFLYTEARFFYFFPQFFFFSNAVLRRVSPFENGESRRPLSTISILDVACASGVFHLLLQRAKDARS
jgi:2-polyprenyl-3-methyl-5-hydroxy-6-metoxy-1,4-benzoquinol methylase